MKVTQILSSATSERIDIDPSELRSIEQMPGMFECRSSAFVGTDGSLGSRSLFGASSLLADIGWHVYMVDEKLICSSDEYFFA